MKLKTILELGNEHLRFVLRADATSAITVKASSAIECRQVCRTGSTDEQFDGGLEFGFDVGQPVGVGDVLAELVLDVELVYRATLLCVEILAKRMSRPSSASVLVMM